MIKKDIVKKKIDSLMIEINYCTELFYISPCYYTKSLLASQIREKMSNIRLLMDILESGDTAPDEKAADVPKAEAQPDEGIKIKDLAAYDGKNGSPAYVAVNGKVYDVTENEKWTSGRHFGMEAGKDLSRDFGSCHGEIEILDKVKVVGKLLE